MRTDYESLPLSLAALLLAALLACRPGANSEEVEHQRLAQAEAKEMVGKLAQAAIDSFHRPSGQLCGSAPAPVPAQLKPGKYQVVVQPWLAGDMNTGFACLRFSIQDPQWCQYDWKRTSTSEGVATAKCDPNGTGKPSVHLEARVKCQQDECTQQIVDKLQ